jgi:Tfp pilus assembly protein FimV
MNGTARTASLACFGAAVCLALYATTARTQGGSIYVVRSGDSVLSIAEQARPKEATVSQMALALVLANPKVFRSRSADRLPIGSALMLPDEATVLKATPSVAESEFSRYWRGEQHYRAGLALEKSKDMFYAFATYVYAAQLGNGPAQARLGELYDHDFSGFVKRDLVESMRWYERARASQTEVRSQRSRSARF